MANQHGPEGLEFYQSDAAHDRVLGRKHPATSSSSAALDEQDGALDRRRLSLVGADVLRSAFTLTEEEGDGDATPTVSATAVGVAQTTSPRASRLSCTSESDVSILFEGWLLFRQRQLRNWKRRWVALCCGSSFGGLGLQWFDLSSDRGTQGSVGGITGCQIEENAPYQQPRFAFSVQCRGDGEDGVGRERELFLRAEDEDGMMQWIAAIQDGLSSLQ